jgi:hypothetical protein
VEITPASRSFANRVRVSSTSSPTRTPAPAPPETLCMMKAQACLNLSARSRPAMDTQFGAFAALTFLSEFQKLFGEFCMLSHRTFRFQHLIPISTQYKPYFFYLRRGCTRRYRDTTLIRHNIEQPNLPLYIGSSSDFLKINQGAGRSICTIGIWLQRSAAHCHHGQHELSTMGTVHCTSLSLLCFNLQELDGGRVSTRTRWRTRQPTRQDDCAEPGRSAPPEKCCDRLRCSESQSTPALAV